MPPDVPLFQIQARASWRHYVQNRATGPAKASVVAVLMAVDSYFPDMVSEYVTRIPGPTLKDLEDATRLSRSTVIRALRWAVRNGWLTQHVVQGEGRGWRRRCYVPTLPEQLSGGVTMTPRQERGGVTVTPRQADGGVTMTPRRNGTPIEDLDLNQVRVPKVDLSSGFEDAWKAYPPRGGKKRLKAKALEVWKRKHLHQHADAIMADIVDRKKNDEQWRGGYPQDMVRYLRNEAWKDETVGAVTEEAPRPKIDPEVEARRAAFEQRKRALMDRALLAQMLPDMQAGENLDQFEARIAEHEATRAEAHC